jgi:phosphatidylinositol alpha-1,6-mannosyltransferase
MKILALVTDAFGGSGGMARFNRDLLSSLASLGDTFEIVALPRKTERPLQTPLPAHLCQKAAIANPYFYSLGAFDVFRREGPFELILCTHIFMAPLAALLSRFFRVPFWVQIYGAEVWHKNSKLVRCAVEQAALVTALSRHTRRKFLEFASIDPARVRVVPGVAELSPVPGPRPAAVLQRYKLLNKKIILTVGRMSSDEKYKGQDRVIRVLPRLLGRFPDLVYLIVGEGPDRYRLETLAREMAVGERLIFTGYLSDEALREIYRLADLFVMPSTEEGFGMVFLEAAAHGIPVIGGKNDGSFDALLEGRLGRLVDPDDSGELERAISDAFNRPSPPDRSLLDRFSQRCFENHLRAILEENFR